MLTSIAAIATALSALIGVGYMVIAAVSKDAAIKKAKSIQDITEQIKAVKTPEERAQLQDALNKLINS